MKLRKKVSLLCSLVLVLAVGICSAILIDRAGDKILNLTYANAQQKQQSLVTAFTNMLTYYHDELDSSATSRSLMKYCFSQVADAEAVLKADGETLCSSLSIDPGDYLLYGRTLPAFAFAWRLDIQELALVPGRFRLWYLLDSLQVGDGRGT